MKPPSGRFRTVLTRRALNRTLLTRQFLAERTCRSSAEVVRHLVAMQAQEPNWPYVGLWTRVADLRHAEPTALYTDRTVVRGPLLRGTQHMATAEDYAWIRPLLQPAPGTELRPSYYARETRGLAPAELAAAGRELLGEGQLTRRALGRLLAERYPGRSGAVLTAAVQRLLPIVHPTPDGVWGGWGTRPSVSMALAPAWTGRAMDPAPAARELIGRYLAAFGPATVADVQGWSGLKRLRDVVEGMPLRALRDVDGRELYDLPDAELADEDRPAPVRFLPAYDNVLLGHVDRSRILADEDRRLVMPGGALVLPTFLVDGFVHGTWSVHATGLRIRPFRPLSPDQERQVAEEASRLAEFAIADPDARRVDIAA
ncbi:winged helix DNA-binding domain-containing protein [Embleya scabrispora]|uniref:winged helix DNA-binding domain-containing protein n=1 Tax=Embleya scabrispora TaxID=159449 RepID=UPI000476F3C0|nr:winged helix DNA-binding domain-containing protein [Embleya scabrispora]MYS82675.1 winged helix DNA-binding domain-containing protein [Streptomyces sp. SID5474]